MGVLKDLNIVSGEKNKTVEIFEELFSDFRNIPYDKPADYVGFCWERYSAYITAKDTDGQSKRTTNGKIFEYIIATLLVRENIFPFYMDAQVAFVPNVYYDFILYSKEFGPVCLSAKVSTRERYKQADLEAGALKNVHRKSKSFLLVANAKDAKSINKKIDEGEVMGLEKVIDACSADMNGLIDLLKKLHLTDPPMIKVVTATRIVK